jgi:aspartate kinase
MATLVMKFGGSLTANAERLGRVAQIVQAEMQAWDRVVVVVSAMAGVTDELVRAVELAAAQNATSCRRTVAALRARHLDLIAALPLADPMRRHLTDSLDRRLFDVITACDRVLALRSATSRESDIVMAAGEQVMAAIVAVLLRDQGVPASLVGAETLIVTDEISQNANPIFDLIEERVDRLLRPVLDQGVVPVVAGFIGATRGGMLTTLGRGGSDLTATLLGAALRADEVWMWTNVDGIMSTDPEWVPGARVIPVLSYEEVGELSYFGARVLHPDAVEPLAQRAIPLRVRNPDNLDHAGTLIQAEAPDAGPALKAVSAVHGVCLTMRGEPLDLGEFLGQIRHLVGGAVMGPVIVMQSHLQALLVFVIPTSEGRLAVGPLVERLAAELPRWRVEPVMVIAAIGAPAVSSDELGVHFVAEATGPGRRRLIAVRVEDARKMVRRLHRLTEDDPRSSPSQMWPAPLRSNPEGS